MVKYLTIEDIEGTNYTSLLLSYPILSRDLYLGIKDRNGKEIYEGDIILGSARTLAGEVRFEDAGFIVVRPNDGFDDIRGNLGSYYEVIGNIYENPELLEKS